ncbi:unnamed protein product [Camellia sinensis]
MGIEVKPGSQYTCQLDPGVKLHISQWYYSHSNDYLEICRCYKAIYEIPSVRKEPAKWIPEVEKHLSEMVVSKALVAKIDRPMGIVCFQAAKDSNDILNSWAMNLEKLLDLVEKSCHQIHKETMVHKAALKGVLCSVLRTY